TMRNGGIGNHGTESGQRNRGTRSMEIYGNTFEVAMGHVGIDLRSATAVIFNNTFVGAFSPPIKLNNYRNHTIFQPWGLADGTKLWGAPDLSDGPGTPGGAGDGVFEAGRASLGGLATLSDNSKSWSPNQWVGYTLRTVHS